MPIGLSMRYAQNLKKNMRECCPHSVEPSLMMSYNCLLVHVPM